MSIIGYLFLAYLGVGLAFSIAFVTKGAGNIDEGARGSGIGFRLMIVPGAMLLWPYLLRRWLAGGDA